MLLKPRYPQLQRSDPLARGLLAFWTFYEGAGSGIHDLVSHNDGTLNLLPVDWRASATGSSFYIPNLATQANISTAFTDLSYSSGTIVWSVTAISYSSLDQTQFWGQFKAGVGEFDCQLDQSGNWLLGWNQQISLARSTSNYPVGTPSNYAFTWASSGSKFHQNGIQIASTGTAPSPVNFGVNFALGRLGVAGTSRNRGDYLLHYLGIYTRALSAGEIAQQNQDPLRPVRPRSEWWRNAVAPAASSIVHRRTLGQRTGSRAA